VPTVSKTAPTLRDIALDHLNVLAKAIRKAEPTMTPEAAMLRAVQSAEGRATYELYRAPVASLPWPEAIAKFSKAGTKKAPSVSDLYSALQARAIAAAPDGTNPADAVSQYVKTPAGRVAWRRYEDARTAAGEGS
jgi:hypothetical protein